MTINFQQYVTTEEDCICFSPVELSSVRECLHMIGLLVNHCRENGVTQVMMNISRLFRDTPTGLEVFQFGTGLAQIWPSGVRLVVICQSQQYDSGRFAQTVAQNRGFSFSLYEVGEEDKARAWLNRPVYHPPEHQYRSLHSLDIFSDNS
jgi:hypothetical protein